MYPVTELHCMFCLLVPADCHPCICLLLPALCCCCCCCLQINGTKYASYRVLVRFNSTTTTAVKDTMYLGAVSGPCVGGYNETLYSNVAALFKDFKVSQNSEWLALQCFTVWLSVVLSE